MWRKLVKVFFGFPVHLDRWLRWRDFYSNRIEGTWLHRRGFVPEHSVLALLLPVPVLFVLAYGMPQWRGPWIALACGLTVLVLVLLSRRTGPLPLSAGQSALIVVLTVGTWLFAGGDAVAYDATPYRHVFGIFGAIALVLSLLASRPLAQRLIGRERDRFRSHFADNLQHVQLFVIRRNRRQDSGMRVLRAYALVPLTSPLLLAFFPSFALLFARPGWVGVVFFAALFFAWALLAAGHYNDHLRTFQVLVHQMFLVGAPTVVSLLVILFAVTRLAGVSYVTTVLDQASWTVIVSLIFILYLILWLYDYWVQRAAAEVMLSLLSRDHGDRVVQLPLEGGRMGTARLQIHGAGRFVVVRESEHSHADSSQHSDLREPPNFETYRPLDVFRQIHEQVRCRARAGEAKWAEVDGLADSLDALTEKVRLHAVIPAVVVGLIVGSGFFLAAKHPQRPALIASQDAAPEELFDLGNRLTELGDTNEPVYAVALSGGGTRAALYGYSVLAALDERQALDRVVLASSVSGGSAALAYYAAHQGNLSAPADWQRFRDAMASTFIQDVLAGTGEWRFLRGARNGKLLSESFVRYFFDDEPQILDSAGELLRPSLASVKSRLGFGVVFNTGVAGSWEDDAADPCVRSGLSAPDCASNARTGSRLVLTNVAALSDTSVATHGPGWPLDLEYTVLHELEAPLTTTAALSANFPPVFSNAMIDVKGGEAAGLWWVTDGGSIDNRGLITLLLALRAELASGGLTAPLPPLKILVAEASGHSVGYSDKRGLGAVGGARGKIADKLLAELVAEVTAGWSHLGAQAEVVYLPMPEVVRTSFGTHWQLPANIKLEDPTTWWQTRSWSRPSSWLQRKPAVKLDDRQILEMIDLLFADDAARRASNLGSDEEVTNLWRWVTASLDGDPRDTLDQHVPGG